MTLDDEDVRKAIAVQAGDWLIANESGPLTDGDAAAFLAWLRASPIHVREYLGVARIAHQLPAVVGDPTVPLETFLAENRLEDDRVASIDVPAPTSPRSTARRPTPLPWPALASAVACVIVLAVAAVWWGRNGELLGLPKTYRTAHGEARVVQLPDGSVLRLDTDSEVTVRYSDRERLVELNRGQALFHVDHELRRWFRVTAGRSGAIAVGTDFDVYRKSDAIEFTVAEGTIAVFTSESLPADGGKGLPLGVQLVTKGFRLRLDADAAPAQPVLVDLEQALGWVQHKIVFKRQPVGDICIEFNRYTTVPIEVEDPTIRNLPISGVFDAADTDSFVAFLRTLPGVRIEKTGTRIRVLRVAPTP